MVLVARSTSPRASRRAVAIALLLACAACGRNFDDLFPSGSGESASGAGSSGTSGASGTSSGSSGTSGTSGTADGISDNTDAVDKCACLPCEGSSCKLTCPVGCKSCACAPFTCPAGEPCNVGCTTGASCDVFCPDKTTCNVTCASDSTCTCTGIGCDVSCGTGDLQLCAKQVTCNLGCK